MSLEMRVSAAVAAVSLLERALHAEHGWEMEIDGTKVPATRDLTETGVVLSARFPALETDTYVYLSHDGVMLAAQPTTPSPEPFYIDWALEAQTVTATA